MQETGTTAPTSYRFWTEEKLRNADTDRQGHVNNAVIATFLESGRIDVLDQPPLAEVRKVTGIVVVRLLVNYRKELFFPGTVRVGTRLDRVGRTSLTFGQAVCAGDALIADAEVTCVLVDKATRKPVAVPEAMRAFLVGA
ncbi:MAG: acyl-CoA thioesterase [Burkholderiales bacterium]|nr:acyl-CoA thioesterase [Burkholderiales bacterium]